MDHAEQMRSIRAQVALEYAFHPHIARQSSVGFGGDGKIMTKDDVAAEFGNEAANHWQNLADEKAAFMREALAHPTGD